MKALIIAIALLIPVSAYASGKYFILSTVESVEKDADGKDVITKRTVAEEKSLPTMLQDEPTNALDRIETYVEAEGVDDEGKAITYAKRVTAREWHALGRPKRLSEWHPDLVVYGYKPDMPSDAEIEKALDELADEPILDGK